MPVHRLRPTIAAHIAHAAHLNARLATKAPTVVRRMVMCMCSSAHGYIKPLQPDQWLEQVIQAPAAGDRSHECRLCRQRSAACDRRALGR